MTGFLFSGGGAASLTTRNVKDYGATGNGVTDDSAAIQMALGWHEMVTSSSTTSGTTLNFASVPSWVVAGMMVIDLTAPSIKFDTPTTVVSTTSTTVVISNAVTGTVGSGDNIGFGNPVAGEIFFPPGVYIIGSTIKLPSSYIETSFTVRGTGEASEIRSTTTGYTFERKMNLGAGVGACILIENLLIRGNSATTNNGIRIEGIINVSINNVSISGCQIGIYYGPNVYCGSITNCDLRGATYSPVTTGSVGIQTGCTFADTQSPHNAGAPQSVIVQNCNLVNFSDGIRWGCGGTVENCRFETNDVGLNVGTDPEGNAYPATINALGISGEANYRGVYVRSCGLSAFISVGFQGSNPSGFVTASLYGIKVADASNTLFSSIRGSSHFTSAAIDLTGSAINNTYIGCTGAVATGGGAAWIMATGTMVAANTYIQCNNPVQPMTFTQLPGQAGCDGRITAVEGMEYSITDCNTATFLATAAAGGSGATARRRVRYNGSSTVWQVIG